MLHHAPPTQTYHGPRTYTPCWRPRTVPYIRDGEMDRLCHASNLSLAPVITEIVVFIGIVIRKANSFLNVRQRTAV